ncbi:type II toxin-antitoxin system RelE/ParE family toxin [Alteromonas confluentis]|uniref:type II toxin-antitoxin system RelE/ParE family toxin n=1 Tax=Alteromonas confluentis TaxID=1656094 RepID=UPI0009F65FA9
MSLLPLRFAPEVEYDISDAFSYFEHCQKGLGDDYILSVEQALSKLQHNPFHYPRVHKSVRRMLVRRFPFCVYYLPSADKITVLAVLHCSRSDSLWKKRT